MKLISWNVNGIRAAVKKGFEDFFTESDADFFCLQETKLQEGQIDLKFPGYQSYWNYADRKGYSGTAIFTKHTPLSVRYGIDQDEHNHEGRAIILEYNDFYLVTVYTPNSKQELARLEYRIKWEHDLTDYLVALNEQKPVILCGDLNVAHTEIDLKNPKNNRNNPGFSDDERHCFSYLLDQGFTDSFRYFNPDLTGAYSWWSYRFNARANNAGWRIDYFVVSDKLKDKMTSTAIHKDVMGSDHCPVALEIDL